MKFRLIRFVLAAFDAEVAEWAVPNPSEAGVSIKLFGQPMRNDQRKSTTALFEASRVVDELVAVGDEIHVPEDVRRELEGALESHIDILAVLHLCTRSMCSPQPYIAVEPLTSDALEWLRNKQIKVSTASLPFRMFHEFDLAKALPLLADRLDGVAILAESLGHSHPTGQLHELIRFFERAFALKASRICQNELPKFLTSNDQGYSKREIEQWLHLRDTTSHADRRPNFALQADTRPVVNRVEQAAYDVLFNKSSWRDTSLTRREVFRPHVGSKDTNGGLRLTIGTRGRVSFTLVDGFHAYHYNIKAQIKHIPETWVTNSFGVKEQDKTADAESHAASDSQSHLHDGTAQAGQTPATDPA